MNVLAVSLPDGVLGEALRWLAAVGAGLAGGFVIGLATQALVGIAGGQKTPQPVLWLVRILGGIVCAWLTFLALGAGGQGGGPGPGGPGTGTGAKETAKEQTKEQTRDDKGTFPEKDRPKTEPGKKSAVAEVEILDKKAIDALSAPEKPNYYACYRLNHGRKLLTLDAALKELEDQRDPKVEKVIVTEYGQGWPPQDPRVSKLRDAVEQWKAAGVIKDREFRELSGSALDH
jgi:hypothetical protein